MENERKLSFGSAEQGKNSFNQIAKKISKHDNFNFYQSNYYSNQTRSLGNPLS
ncbi:MAG: hypothetical protein NY202_04965 [Mollicutes bacterium UO1]